MPKVLVLVVLLVLLLACPVIAQESASYKLGEHTFQYVVEERERAPRVYAIPDVEE